MNFVYYILGAFLTLVLTVLYLIITQGSILLNQNVLTDLAVRAIIAGVSFLAADYLMKKRG